MGRIAPRYCTTSRLPTFSTASVRTCSRRVTVSSGMATRRPPPMAASSMRCRSVSQGAAGQRLDVEDEGDGAVTEDGGAGVEADRLHLATDGLDDDLLGVDHPVHDQAEPPALGPQHRDDHVAVVPLGG